MRAFWRSGFEGTSITDLEAATGVGRRQLYNAYGDKRGVFLQALGDFHQAGAGLLLADLDNPRARLQEVRAGLPLLIDTLIHKGERLGCLFCNAACEEIGQTDAEVRDAIVTFWQRIDTAYMNALRNAVRLGELDATQRQTTQIARHFRASHIAICIMARAGEPEAVLREIAAATERILEA